MGYPKETNLRKQQLIIVTQNVQFLLLIPHGLHVTSFILLNFHQTMLRWLMLKGLRTIVMNCLNLMMAMINIPICVNNLSLSINRTNQSIVLRLLLISHIKLLRSRKRKDTCLVLLHALPFSISFELLFLLIRGYFVFISCVFIVWMKIMVKLFLNHFFY